MDQYSKLDFCINFRINFERISQILWMNLTCFQIFFNAFKWGSCRTLHEDGIIPAFRRPSNMLRTNPLTLRVCSSYEINERIKLIVSHLFTFWEAARIKSKCKSCQHKGIIDEVSSLNSKVLAGHEAFSLEPRVPHPNFSLCKTEPRDIEEIQIFSNNRQRGCGWCLQITIIVYSCAKNITIKRLSY